MIRTGPSMETMREINRILEQKPIMEEQTDECNEEQTEEETDECDEETESETEEQTKAETTEAYNKRIVESYKPRKISFLTIDDEYNMKIEKRNKPVIYGLGICPCGGSITKANKARHIKSYRHQRYMDKLADE